MIAAKMLTSRTCKSSPSPSRKRVSWATLGLSTFDLVFIALVDAVAPEYVVKRNDSLCMASKEHTQNLISGGAAQKNTEDDYWRRSIQGSVL